MGTGVFLWASYPRVWKGPYCFCLASFAGAEPNARVRTATDGGKTLWSNWQCFHAERKTHERWPHHKLSWWRREWIFCIRRTGLRELQAFFSCDSDTLMWKTIALVRVSTWSSCLEAWGKFRLERNTWLCDCDTFVQYRGCSATVIFCLENGLLFPIVNLRKRGCREV